MVLEIVSVFDSAVEAFGRPVFVPAVGAGTRSFLDEVNNKDSEIGKHPRDYKLFHLGSFDDVTGKFAQFPAPKLIIEGVQGVAKEKVRAA